MKDFRDFLASGACSDVRLEVFVQAPQPPDATASEEVACKRARAEGVTPRPASTAAAAFALDLHAIVLRKESVWAHTMLSSGEWAEAQQRRLRLEVASGAEADAVRNMVEAMYAADPLEALAPLTHSALLQVLCMADRLQAPDVTAAAGKALTAAKLIEWSAALAVWALPAGCADSDAYRPAYKAAVAAVRRRFKDLDSALNDASGRKRLRKLPLAALAAVLGDDGTRAASENTVYAVADMWLHARGGGSDAERAALSGCVRCMYLTPSFLAGVASRSEWLARDAGFACALQLAVLPLHARDACRKEWQRFPGAQSAALQQRARHASSVGAGCISWDLPLPALAALYADAARCGRATLSLYDIAPDSVCYWGGCSWWLNAVVAKSSRGDGWMFGVRFQVAPPPGFNGHPDLAATLQLSVLGSEYEVVSDGFTTPIVRGRAPTWWFQGGLSRLGLQAGWDEAAWRAAGLLDGGVLRLFGEVIQVF